MTHSGDPISAGTGGGSSPLFFVAKAANLLFTLSLTFVGLTAITFIIGRVMPADPVLAIVGDRASQEVYEAMYLKLGLDKPLIQQFLIYLLNVLQGDFGRSITATPQEWPRICTLSRPRA